MYRRQHDLYVAWPSPAQVDAIVIGYGWHAALERWPDLNYGQLKGLRAAAKKRQPAESKAQCTGGQPARRLEGVDPLELFQPPEDWLSSVEAHRECGQ